MSKLAGKDIEHVAKLAKLSLTPKEIGLFQKQLSNVIEYIGQLNEVETSKTQPTSQTTGLENVFRKDEINSQQILTQENDYFEVDAVLEERDK